MKAPRGSVAVRRLFVLVVRRVLVRFSQAFKDLQVARNMYVVTLFHYAVDSNLYF